MKIRIIVIALILLCVGIAWAEEQLGCLISFLKIHARLDKRTQHKYLCRLEMKHLTIFQTLSIPDVFLQAGLLSVHHLSLETTARTVG